MDIHTENAISLNCLGDWPITEAAAFIDACTMRMVCHDVLWSYRPILPNLYGQKIAISAIAKNSNHVQLWQRLLVWERFDFSGKTGYLSKIKTCCRWDLCVWPTFKLHNLLSKQLLIPDYTFLQLFFLAAIILSMSLSCLMGRVEWTSV